MRRTKQGWCCRWGGRKTRTACCNSFRIRVGVLLHAAASRYRPNHRLSENCLSALVMTSSGIVLRYFSPFLPAIRALCNSVTLLAFPAHSICTTAPYYIFSQGPSSLLLVVRVAPDIASPRLVLYAHIGTALAQSYSSLRSQLSGFIEVQSSSSSESGILAKKSVRTRWCQPLDHPSKATPPHLNAEVGH